MALQCARRWSTRSAGHHLSARFGDRPLRFPLRLLHGGGHDFPAQGRHAVAGGARPAVLGLRRARACASFASPAASRWCAADIMTLFSSLSRHLGSGAPRRADADHQRLAARPIRRGARSRTACGASTSRSTRSIPAKFTRHHPLGRCSTRCWPASTRRKRPASKIKINAVALKGVNEDEFADLIEWAHGARHGPHPDRGDAARRDRRRPHSTSICRCRMVRARLARTLYARGHRLSHRRPGALRARRRDRRAARLHHAAHPQFLRDAATACGSPAPARSTCASARRMRPICATPLRASEGDELLACARSTRRSPASPRATISSSTGGTSGPAVARHMSVTGG